MFKRLLSLSIIAFLLSLLLSLPAHSQLFGLPDLRESSSWFPQKSDQIFVSRCIYLDGICVIKITGSKADIDQRVKVIENRLKQISNVYLNNPVSDLKTWQKDENGLPNIYIATGGEEIRLLTVTRLDSQNDGVDPETKATQMIEQINHELKVNKQEKQPKFLLRNGLISFGVITGILIINFLLVRRLKQLQRSQQILTQIPQKEKPISTQSNQWSRADVNIPVDYSADIDQALKLIEETVNQMKHEDPWREMILEDPQVLGVENFSDRALMIRVWIKTQPLKQWDVSREFRRRLKIIFEDANIPIPLPQHHITVISKQ